MLLLSNKKFTEYKPFQIRSIGLRRPIYVFYNYLDFQNMDKSIFTGIQANTVFPKIKNTRENLASMIILQDSIIDIYFLYLHPNQCVQRVSSGKMEQLTFLLNVACSHLFQINVLFIKYEKGINTSISQPIILWATTYINTQIHVLP